MRKKYMSLALVALGLSLTFAPLVRAEEAQTETVNGYSKEVWDKLMDNTLEYNEIDDLVHNFNPDIALARKKFNSNVDSISNNIDELEVARQRIHSLADSAKENKDMEDYALYAGQLRGFKATIENLTKSKKSLLKANSSGVRELESAEKKVASGVRSLMINYEKTVLQKQTLNEIVELNKKILETSKVTVAVGTATADSINKAQTNLLKAQSDVENLKANEEQLRRSLISLCGWKVTDNPVIAPINADSKISDEAINSINLEEDIKKAIGNNKDILAVRGEKFSHNETKLKARNAEENQLTDKLKADMNKLYQDILSKKLAFDSSKAGFESEEVKKNAADTKKRLGMLSDVEYNEVKLAYNQAKLNMEGEKLNLLLSVLDYEEAIAGNLSE
jgi:hypothetical protein